MRQRISIFLVQLICTVDKFESLAAICLKCIEKAVICQSASIPQLERFYFLIFLAGIVVKKKPTERKDFPRKVNCPIGKETLLSFGAYFFCTMPTAPINQ